MVAIAMSGASSIKQEQEQLIVSKNKKKYVSEQQYVELDGELVVVTNENIEISSSVQLSLSLLQQLIVTVQKRCLTNLNNYIDGEKDCFLKQVNKVQRTDCYEKLLACRHKIESCTQKTKRMQQQIEAVYVDLQQQFQ